MKIIKSHLKNSRIQFLKYFPEIEGEEWHTRLNYKSFLRHQHQFIWPFLKIKINLAGKFENLPICYFWSYALNEHKEWPCHFTPPGIHLNLLRWAGFLCVHINQNETQKSLEFRMSSYLRTHEDLATNRRTGKS